MMLCLRHRSASGDLANGWEYLPHERSILCNVREGNLSVEFRVEVCARERLAFGAHPIVRLGAEEWCILPERVIRTWPHRQERLDTIRCPVNAALGMRGITLTNAVEDVSALLEAL